MIFFKLLKGFRFYIPKNKQKIDTTCIGVSRNSYYRAIDSVSNSNFLQAIGRDVTAETWVFPHHFGQSIDIIGSRSLLAVKSATN